MTDTPTPAFSNERTGAQVAEILRHSPNWVIAAGIAGAYLIFCLAAPRVRYSSAGAVFFSTAVALGLIIWFTSHLARSLRTSQSVLFSVAGALAVGVPTRVLLATKNPEIVWVYQHFPGILDLLFVWLAASIGVTVSFLLKSANMIPPVAAVLADRKSVV